MRTTTIYKLKNWRRPEILLLLMAGAVPLSFATWQALLNNFAIESAAFTGVEIGVLQSLREIPGFLAFAIVFVLLVFREQTLAYISLALLGIGTAITGYFPTVIGLYCTTVLTFPSLRSLETLEPWASPPSTTPWQWVRTWRLRSPSRWSNSCQQLIACCRSAALGIRER